MQSKIWPHFNKLNTIKMLGTLALKSMLPLLCSVSTPKLGWAALRLWQHHVGHGMEHTGHVQALMALERLEPQAFGPKHDPKPNQAAQHKAGKVCVVMRSYFHISSTPGAANKGSSPAGLVWISLGLSLNQPQAGSSPQLMSSLGNLLYGKRGCLASAPKGPGLTCSSAVLLSWSRGARPPSDPGSALWPCSCVENHRPERNHGIQHTPHEPDLAWNAPSTTPHTSGWLCLLQLHVQFKIQLEIGNWLFLGSHMENAIIGPKKTKKPQQWDSSVTLQKARSTTEGIIYHDSSI